MTLRCLPRLAAASLLAASSLTAQGYICAEGGGNEQNGSWAPSVFGWMVDNAPGDKDVVILGVSGADAGMAATFLANGAGSVTNLAVNATNADLQATYDTIAAADIVWMRGGNQANYVNFWNDTLTEQAIRDVYDAGGVVGGTSAGCAVLGEVIYDSIGGSAQNRTVLQNPFHPSLTFTDDFLELTPGVMFDTHFTERGRLGRMAVMLARIFEDSGEDVIAIGVDDRTALCVSPDLTAEVRGEAAVTFLHRTASTQQILEAGEPVVFTDLAHTQLTPGYVYDLTTRTVVSRPATATLVAPPTGTPSYTTTSISGGLLTDKAKGDTEIVDNNDDFALFDGTMQFQPGQGLVDGAVISTRVWQNTAFDENRVGGPQYAAALDPHALLVYVDGNNGVGNQLVVQDSEHLGVVATTLTKESSVMLTDTWGVTSVDVATTGGTPGNPRQACALEGVTTHLIRSGWGYDAAGHAVVSPTQAWSDLGGGLAGFSGVPVFAGEGTWVGQTPLEVSITNARPNTTAALFVGLAQLDAPFKGGVLGPTPDVLITGLPIGAGGELALPASSPTGLPPGVTFFFQAWIVDADGPQGFSATNTVSATTP